MVSLSRMTKGLEGRIFAKLEYLNPGFSKKDRAALQMIVEAEQAGALSPGQTVVELTSGNQGTGLSIVCAVKGYPFVAVMSKGKFYGKGAHDESAWRRSRARRSSAGRHSRPGVRRGPRTGGRGCAATHGRAQRASAPISSGTRETCTPTNITRRRKCGSRPPGRSMRSSISPAPAELLWAAPKGLKKHKPGIRCYLIEPKPAPYLAGKTVSNPSHQIQGGGYNMELPFLERSLVHDYLQVSDEGAIETTRELARKEGIFAGFSSGANVAAALQIAPGTRKGRQYRPHNQ